uniref:Uncharacterized protein n=1 Tax=Arundo donax TaxID=35708 RepID=A0A0A9GB25_ARUDO
MQNFLQLLLFVQIHH